MKPLTTFAIAAGAYILYNIFSKAQAAKNLKVYFQGVSLVKSSGAIPNILANFKLINPSNGELSVRSIAGDFYLNGRLVASFSQLENFKIPGNSESRYQIKVTPQGIPAVLSLVDLIRTKAKNVIVQFDGTINTGGVNLPINQNMQLT